PGVGFRREGTGRSREGALGVDDPLALAQWLEVLGEGFGIGERGVLAEELELTGVMRMSLAHQTPPAPCSRAAEWLRFRCIGARRISAQSPRIAPRRRPGSSRGMARLRAGCRRCCRQR